MGSADYTIPRRDTRGYQLLTLIAICGEFPVSLLDRLPTSASYQEIVVTSLKKNKLLKTYYRDKVRSYRLRTRAKEYLLSEQPERFSFYLTGNADTNLLKSEISRRLRLHRIAEIYVCMMNAGVEIFRDKKPTLFSPEWQLFPVLESPAFYNSREIKEIGMEAIKIRGSRMVGVLAAPSGIFLTYNGAPHTAKWDFRSEYRAKVLLEIILCQQRLPSQYAGRPVTGLLFGNGTEPFTQILSSSDGESRCFFLLDGIYEHFYYLTNDHRGDVMLKLLCDPDRTAELNRILGQGLNEKNPGLSFENDALDEQGNPVLFGYFLDIPRIYRYLTALSLQERIGTIICFDFQKEALQPLCNENIRLQTISFEKFERRFFPSAKEN